MWGYIPKHHYGELKPANPTSALTLSTPPAPLCPCTRKTHTHKLNTTQAWRFLLKCTPSWTTSWHAYVQTGMHTVLLYIPSGHVSDPHTEQRSDICSHTCSCTPAQSYASMYVCTHVQTPVWNSPQGPFWQDRTPLTSVWHVDLPRCQSSFMATDNQRLKGENPEGKQAWLRHRCCPAGCSDGWTLIWLISRLVPFVSFPGK